MKRIDLNCDLGESFGNYHVNDESRIMPYISSANIACGYHAGDPENIEKSIRLALEHDINIGAHPSYPDLQGFGRRSMKMKADEIRSMVVYQVAALKGICESLGGHLIHVKPHGALYNDAVKYEEVAQAIVRAVLQISPSLKLIGLSGSHILTIAEEQGLKTVSEVFADRAYNPDGTLVPRSLAGAVIHDIPHCLERVLDMIEYGRVKSTSGQIIQVKAETICIHGDNPEAVNMSQELHDFLLEKGIQIGK